VDWRILWSKLARMGSEDWGFNFPRCALKKECASIRHSETVAFMAWRFIFVCAIVLKDEKKSKDDGKITHESFWIRVFVQRVKSYTRCV
jgi:hypothetical protein